MELEDECLHTNQYKEQVEKVNVRIEALKVLLNEVEEEIGKEKAQKCKAQREYDDMLRSHEFMTREISFLKRKLK